MNILVPNFAKRGGVVTVVAQDIKSKRVLMVAYTDESGFMETIRTGIAVYYSTSKKEKWVKGGTTGSFQIVRKVFVDCDGDAVVYQVEQMGTGSCHTGASTCFFREIDCHVNNGSHDHITIGETEKLGTVEIEVSRNLDM